MQKIIIAAALMAGPFSTSQVQAQAEFPARPVTVIVPYAAGGPVDLETRIYTPYWSQAIGQSVLVDYKAGGGSTIGTAYVAKAKPDGYTLAAVTTGFSVLPAFYKDLSFDVNKDFAPISLMSKRTSVLMVSPSSSIRTLKEYIAYARANPGKLNYGTAGIGEISHLVGEWLHALTGTKATFVPYKGTGPMLLELTAGRVDVASGTLVATLPLIRAGKARALAVMGDQRSPQLPDVPTVAEQGPPEFNYANWLGFIAPAGTPRAAVDKLHDGLVKVAKQPKVMAELDSQGSILYANTPAQFAQLIATETVRWQKVVTDSGIQVAPQ